MAFELNDDQRKAVEYYGDKPLLIEAGPGSGKTRVITERVNYLINEKEMDPESFLIITFSNKAARELKERLNEYLEDDIISKMQISTVHSFCYKLLIENTNKAYKILDDDYGTKKNMFIYKHRERLGFKRESTLTRGKVKDVVAAFDKYSTFDVDIEKLIEYIKINEPVSQDYLDFIDAEFRRTGKFPRRKIDLDKKNKNKKTAEYHAYADSWYNALHLQVAKAYPKYLKLLEEYNYLDFNVLQMKALEYLKENPETKYRNILVDEFQDTDPVQIEIFEILMKNALNPKEISKKYDDMEEGIDEQNNLKDVINESNNLKEEIIESDNLKENIINKDNTNNEESEITASFTAVGDIEQSIYGFRGALENYFHYFYKKYDTERMGLNINYRSTDEIIEFSELFIKNQRETESKKNLKGSRNESRPIYYIENEEAEMEAASLARIIQGLKDNEIIENYNDVAILLRSVLTSSKDIINVFTDEGIPFQVKGLQDLEKKDEIRSILTLLHFIVEEDNPKGTPLITNWEAEWLNLRAFANVDFNQSFVKLSHETEEILIEKQKEFEETVFSLAKTMYKDITGQAFRKRSYKGALELEEEALDEIFKHVKKPVLTNETLREYGISNEDDLAFFNRLNHLKSKIFNVEDYNDRPTILSVYYEILEICGFLDEEYVFNPDNKEAMEYIGMFSQIIYEYENIISNRDIRGLYWFLNSNIKNYSYDIEDENGVNIMTIHKSKGLEFPVVILGGLNDEKFPREYENLKEIKYKNGSAVFYTPRECFRYKSLDKDDVLLHYEEEERNIYVAMTRAQDLLILSKNYKKSKKTTYSKSLQKDIDDIELKERISRITEEIEELKKMENIDDRSLFAKNFKEELKEVNAELKELKPLIKEHKKLVQETKRLKELIIEIDWKINDIKYDDMILDELIDLFGLDEDMGLTRDQFKDMFLNDFNADDLENKDYKEDNVENNNYKTDELENNDSDEINNTTNDSNYENSPNEEKPLKDYFEDKEGIDGILARTENDIADLNQKIAEADEKTKKIISKLQELQDKNLNDSKSSIHLKHKMEINSIIEEAIENNEDDSLSKNQIAINALTLKLESIESEVTENKQTIESNKELILKEKELKERKLDLDYKIKVIKDKEGFFEQNDMKYNLSPEEEFAVTKELEELSKEFAYDSIESLEDLRMLKDKIREAESPKLCEEFISNRNLIEYFMDDDKYAKLEILFKIKEFENISDLKDIGILKDRREYDEKSLMLFMSFHYKNQEIELKQQLKFIDDKKNNLSDLIDTYPGIIRLDGRNIYTILKEGKIPNTIQIEDNKKLTLSYSSIESYESCPLKYHLSYNNKFKISDNDAITQGNINHNSLEEINKTIIERKNEYAEEHGIEIYEIGEHLGTIDNEIFISRDEIRDIVKRIYLESPNINREEVTIEYVLENIFDYWDKFGRGFDVLGSEYRFDINREDHFLLIGSIDLLYKTDDGIVILDYKTTENLSPENQKKYKKQLYTYALALKDDSTYNDAFIDKLQIYAIKSKEILDFDFNEDEFFKREDDIGEIANNIKNDIYAPKEYDEKSSACHFCDYSFICKNGLIED